MEIGTNQMNVPPPGGITPYSGTFGRKQLLHLLRRTLFGVSTEDLKYFSGKTLNQVVDELLTVSTTPPDPPLKSYTKLNPATGKLEDSIDTKVPWGTTWVNTVPDYQNEPVVADGPRRGTFKIWWMSLLAEQERNIREKMTLFWSNHLATEADVVNIGIMMYNTNALQRKYALGNFKNLVRDITTDCGMLKYLNGDSNNKNAPDENYARELQELFCVGKGSGSGYTEDDIKAAAKVLTGWTINLNGFQSPATATFRPALHDTTDKKFSAFYGNKIIKGDTTTNGGMNELNQLLDMIFATDEVARFICRKLYTFFVYYDINAEVESQVITPLAEIFRTNNYEIKPVLKALLTSDYFFKDFQYGSMIKSPVDFVVGMIRQYRFQVPGNDKLEARYFFYNKLYSIAKDLSQDLGDPPNVAGWPAYYQEPSYHEIWLNTTTYPKRETSQSDLLKNGLKTGNNFYKAVSNGLNIQFDFVGFVKGFQNPQDPVELMNEAVEMMYGVDVSQSVKDKLKTDYLLQGQVTDYYWTNAYENYVANPSTTDPDAKKVPTILKDLFLYMQTAAEYHLC